MATVTVITARAGMLCESEILASRAGPRPSRDRAKSSRDAPVVAASAAPNALATTPAVIRSPTQLATYWLPRSPSSEPDDVKACTPSASVPNAETSTAVTRMK